MRAKRKNVCQICRSRKLACDGKQPACSQCTLRRITCSGYRQEFVFVSHASSKIENQAELKDGNKKALGYQKKAPNNSDDDHIQLLSSQLASLDGMGAQSETKSRYELDGDIQLIVQHYAPVDKTLAESNPFRSQICGAWVEVLPLLSATKRNKRFLLSAIKTLATAIRHYSLGNELCQPQILEMYCDSLRLMGKALEEARGAFQIEHSAAIMCLAVIDILLPTLESGWMTHVKGVGDLVERLGPESFSSGISYTLFIGFRPLLLMSSIITRRKTFLAREEWTTTPFRGKPVSIMQLLLNKACELPALLERYYNLGNLLEVSNFAAVDRLWEDFRNILSSFREWRLMLDSQAHSSLVWSRPDPGNSSLSAVNVLWFPNLMTAISLTHYWAFEITVRTHLSILGRAVTTIKGYVQKVSLETLSESKNEESVAALAEMICISMSYLLQPEMKLYGPGSAFFTLPTAIQVFQSEQDHCSFQLSRCQQIIDRLASMRIYFPRT